MINLNDLKIQKFSAGMTDECVELYMKTYSREPWNEHWESRDVVVNFFKNHQANNYFLGFTAVIGGSIIGVCTGFLKPWINGTEYYIDDFFVSADYQRQGAGSKFISLIKDKLIEQNIHDIMLNTERGYPSIEFYKRAGFTEAENTVILYSSF